jgi:type I restriction enzyme, S subunit
MREGWSTELIGEVTNILNGGTPKSGVAEYWGGDVLWITPKDMGKLDSKYVSDTSRTITEQGLAKSSAKLIPENSVILSTRAPIGHLAINKMPMATNQGCRGLVPSPALDTIFLFYFLSLNVSLLNDLGSGTTFKELAKSALAGVDIPIPPLPEQKRIVAILDEAFEGIDRAVANAEKNLAKAHELFESYLNKVFTQKGDGWEERALGEACTFSQGIQVGVKSQLVTKSHKGQIRFLRIVDFTQGQEPPRYIEHPGDRYIVDKDDVSLVRYGASTGFVCRGLTGAIANNLFQVTPDNESLSRQFLFYFLYSSVFQSKVREAIGGAAMPAISFSLIKDILIMIPKSAEQIQLVNKFGDLSSETQRLESIYQSKLTALTELKQSLLQKAFSGELTVNDTILNKEAVA